MSAQIMIVDDDPGLTKLMQLILERKGYTVRVATHAHLVLDLLDEAVPELFILDVMMPGMSGTDLCQQLRARPETAQIPVLMLSARGDSETIAEALAAGADDYLVKPVRSHILVEKVRSVLAMTAGVRNSP